MDERNGDERMGILAHTFKRSVKLSAEQAGTIPALLDDARDAFSRFAAALATHPGGRWGGYRVDPQAGTITTPEGEAIDWPDRRGLWTSTNWPSW